jgi:hypothetical protein
MEESGEPCNVVIASIVTETASECVCVGVGGGSPHPHPTNPLAGSGNS